MEQPFLVYNTLVSGMYNSQLTKIINGEDQILKHFIGKVVQEKQNTK